MMTFGQFIELAMEYRRRHNLRLGQAFMGFLKGSEKLHLWIEVSTTHIDPTTDDTRLSPFLIYIEEVWDK